MRTGRALTVSGGRGASQKNFFGGKINWKKKRKKNFRHPPRKFGSDTPPETMGHTPTPPRKYGSDTPPPENLGQTPPKYGSDTPPKLWVRHPPPPENLGQTPPPQKNLEQTPPHVDRQTPVNLLPWPNFVAAGKNGRVLVLVLEPLILPFWTPGSFYPAFQSQYGSLCMFHTLWTIDPSRLPLSTTPANLLGGQHGRSIPFLTYFIKQNYEVTLE